MVLLCVSVKFPSRWRELVLTNVVLVPARREPVLHGPAVGGVDGGAGGDPLSLHGGAGVDAAVHVSVRGTQVGILEGGKERVLLGSNQNYM